MLRRQSRGSISNSSQPATIVSPSTEASPTGAQKLKQRKEKAKAESKMSAPKPQIKAKPKLNPETGKVETPSKRKSPVPAASSDFETATAKPANIPSEASPEVPEETAAGNGDSKVASEEIEEITGENVSGEEGSDDGLSNGRKKSCPSLKGVKELMKRFDQNSKNGDQKKNGKLARRKSGDVSPQKSKTPSPKTAAKREKKGSSLDTETAKNPSEDANKEASGESGGQGKKKAPPKVPPKPSAKAASKAKLQAATASSKKASTDEATVRVEEVPAPVTDDVERTVIGGDSPDSETYEGTAYFVEEAEFSDEAAFSGEEVVDSAGSLGTVEELAISDGDVEGELEELQSTEVEDVEVVVEADQEMEDILISGQEWESTDDIEEVEAGDQQGLDEESGAGQTTYTSVRKRGSKTEIKLRVPPSTINTAKTVTVSDVVQPAGSQTTVTTTTVVKRETKTKTDRPVVKARYSHSRRSRRDGESEEAEDVTDFSAYRASDYRVVRWENVDGNFEYDSEVERVRENIKPIIAARPSIQFILSDKAKRATLKEQGVSDRNALSEESQEVALGLENLAGERQEDKKDMTLLNERLVEYVEKTRFLEVQNKILSNEAELMKAEYREDQANLAARYEVEVEELKRLIGVTTTKCEEVMEKKTSAVENFENHENRLREAEERRDEIQSTKETLLEQLGDIEADLATLRRQVGDFETSSKRYRGSIKHLRKEKALLYSDIEKERIATEEAKETTIKLQGEVEIAKEKEESELNELIGADVRDSMEEDREQWHCEFTERFQEVYKDYLARTKALYVEGESAFCTAILEQQLEDSNSSAEAQQVVLDTQRIRQQIQYFASVTLELETRIAQAELKLKHMEDEKARVSAEHEEKQTALQEELESCHTELSSTRDKIKVVFDKKLDLEAEITRFAELLAGEETRIDDDISSVLKDKRMVTEFRKSRRGIKGFKKFKSAVKVFSKSS